MPRWQLRIFHQKQRQMVDDSPWEDDPRVDHIPEVEWSKITSEFTNSGYREGIIAGKENSLQEGFDAGFSNIGVSLGQELGNLRGIAAAIGSFLKSQRPESPELEELRSISSMLSSIRFSDMAPRDVEAEQHAKEHLDVDDLENAGLKTGTMQHERRTEDVVELKERLALLSTKLGFSRPSLAV